MSFCMDCTSARVVFTTKVLFTSLPSSSSSSVVVLVTYAVSSFEKVVRVLSDKDVEDVEGEVVPVRDPSSRRMPSVGLEPSP